MKTTASETGVRLGAATPKLAKAVERTFGRNLGCRGPLAGVRRGVFPGREKLACGRGRGRVRLNAGGGLNPSAMRERKQAAGGGLKG